jgi:PAS domain S-box-containing protein
MLKPGNLFYNHLCKFSHSPEGTSMSFVYSPYIIPLLISASISIFVAVYAWVRRSTPSAIALSLLAGAIAEWSLGYVLEIAGADLSTKLLGGQIQYFGITTAPLFWIIFAFNHANQGNRLTQRRMFLLAIIPLVTLVLALTTQYHGLIWKTFSIVHYGNFSGLAVTHGLWFWVHTAYSYILLGAGTFILFRSIGQMQGIYRGQTTALFIAIIAPWAANIIFIAGLSPIPNLDITSFAFTISVVGLALGIFGFRLVDITPFARDAVFENMREGVIILDARGRIVDINPIAGLSIGLPDGQALGKRIEEAFGPWPQIVEHFRAVDDANDIMVVGQGQAQRHYALHISPLKDRKSQVIGQMITIHYLGAEALPEPRFAAREPLTHPVEPERPDETGSFRPESRNRIWRGILNFYFPPVKKDLAIRAGVNPIWTQTVEHVLIIILRIVATLGTLAVAAFATSSQATKTGYIPSLLAIMGVLWFLSLVRSIPFGLRVSISLMVIYALAFNEMINFGYSAESFIFFLSFVTLAALLSELRGGMAALIIAVLTMGIFGVLIGSRSMIPLSVSPISDMNIFPVDVVQAMTSLTAFSACAIGVFAAINTLLNTLNRTWQKETQALNLLQQERDLLEQHVNERTSDLSKARDAAVKTSEDLRKYFLAMEQSGSTIVITDTKGRIEYANPKFESLTGYSRTEAVGNNPRVLKSGEHSDAFYQDLWKTIGAGKIWQGEFHNRRKDGSLFWESATIAPLVNLDGQITNYVAIKEDITTKKELQEQLREQNEALVNEVKARQRTTLLLVESEARFRQIVENASDVIYRTDVHGCLSYVNPTAVRLMNFADERELIGKHYLDIAVPSARHKLQRFYDHQYLARTHNTYYEFPAMTHDGREVWLGQSVQLIVENDEVIGFQAVARDITSIKQAQEALSISHKQALESNQLKSQLLSRVSHELRTPLGAVLGYAELLMMDTFGELSGEQKDVIAQIMESADYLNKMVSDLLDEAQAASKKMNLRLEDFSPAALLQRVQTSMDVLAHSKGLILSTELSPELPQTLYGDERRLQQILINLVGNAIKFTPTGNVKIKASLFSPTRWILQVFDTGVGIPQEAKAYIFEPFRQVDNAITHENRGSGLGLSITKQLVELMDGEVSLESTPGVGSTFTITLPIIYKSEKSVDPITA